MRMRDWIMEPGRTIRPFLLRDDGRGMMMVDEDLRRDGARRGRERGNVETRTTMMGRGNDQAVDLRASSGRRASISPPSPDWRRSQPKRTQHARSNAKRRSSKLEDRHEARLVRRVGMVMISSRTRTIGDGGGVVGRTRRRIGNRLGGAGGTKNLRRIAVVVDQITRRTILMIRRPQGGGEIDPRVVMIRSSSLLASWALADASDITGRNARPKRRTMLSDHDERLRPERKRISSGAVCNSLYISVHVVAHCCSLDHTCASREY